MLPARLFGSGASSPTPGSSRKHDLPISAPQTGYHRSRGVRLSQLGVTDRGALMREESAGMAEPDLTPETKVSEVAAHYPAVLRTLEALGIDYCCGGNRTLAEASQSAGMPVERVVGCAQGRDHPVGRRAGERASLGAGTAG